MSRYFTHYWRNSTWAFHEEIAVDGELLEHIAGNLFTLRDVSVGDTIYVVTNLSGNLYLCGKMIAGKICDQHTAAKLVGRKPEDLWEASEHVIAREATPMNFDLRVPLEITTRLRLASGKRSMPLKFVEPGRLDQQTLRGVRELEHSSDLELDTLLLSLEPVKLTKV